MIKRNPSSNNVKYTLFFLCSLLLVGCTSEDEAKARVTTFVATIDKKSVKPIPELPSIQDLQQFTYSAANLRDPFQPPRQLVENKKNNSRVMQPDFNRKKEYLEYVDIEQLSMVGTIKQAKSNELWGLVTESGGNVYRVKVGQFIGKNFGKIVAISSTRVDFVEVVPEGDSEWVERPRQLELTSQATNNLSSDKKRTN